MQTLKSFLNQAMLIWTESTGAGRIGIALLLAICVGGIIGIGVWSSQPNYVILANDLAPDQASKMIDALDSANIKYQIKGSGSMLLVDRQNWSRAKIEAGKLGIEHADENMETASPWMDPNSQQEIFRRNLQKQIENTITRFKTVESATVILSIPKKQAFIRQADSPSASVQIEVAAKAKFGEANASSIASLVASSVNGLTVDQVSITDTLGNEYTTDETLGQLSKQEEFRIMRERELSQKAEYILSKFLGLGNASVAVTTDYTFAFGTTETLEIDPDQKVLTSEEIETKKTRGPNMVAGGVTAATDGGEPAGSSRTEKNIMEQENLKNKYDVSKTSRVETNQTPVLNMMTVSVLVNQTTIQDENQAIPADIKAQIEGIVSKAVGLRDAKDEISVEFFAFIDTLPTEEEPAAAIPWDQINQILRNVSLGIAALVALFIGLKVLKSFRPNQVESEPALDQTSQINQLSDMVKDNPEIFSKIIATWSNLDSKSDNDSSASKAA